jgi:hypothetical protein
MLARCVAAAALVLTALAVPGLGFNFFAHRVVADIAWQRLDEPTRDKIVATLRRHPRFEDFTTAKRETVEDEDRWIFQYAAVWPDAARGLPRDEQRKYNNPSWHYVNFPIVLDGKPAPEFNLADGDPQGVDALDGACVRTVQRRRPRRELHSHSSEPESALAVGWTARTERHDGRRRLRGCGDSAAIRSVGGGGLRRDAERLDCREPPALPASSLRGRDSPRMVAGEPIVSGIRRDRRRPWRRLWRGNGRARPHPHPNGRRILLSSIQANAGLLAEHEWERAAQLDLPLVSKHQARTALRSRRGRSVRAVRRLMPAAHGRARCTSAVNTP